MKLVREVYLESDARAPGARQDVVVPGVDVDRVTADVRTTDVSAGT